MKMGPFGWTWFFFIAWTALAEAGSPAESQELDRLAEEIEGSVVYSRPPDSSREETVWMLDKLQIGEWQPRTIAEGVCGRFGPDGRYLAVFRPDPQSQEERNSGSIWIINDDGTVEWSLYQGPIFREAGACPIDFHPNNREIVFIREDGSIGAVDIDKRTVRDLSLPGSYARELQLDGYGELLVSRWRGKGDWAMLRRMVLVEPLTRVVRVYAAGCSAALSPDAGWMTTNHDGHDRMSLVYRDFAHRVTLAADSIVGPGHGWHNWHWSNHNDYIAVEVFKKTRQRYRGPTDAWVLRFSDRRATRVTVDREANFPDLFVSRDRRTGSPVPKNGGRSFSFQEVYADPYDLARTFRTKGETGLDPGGPRRVLRTVVDAELTRITPIDFFWATKYDRVLVEHVYTPRKVIRGTCNGGPIVVAHWAVCRRKPVAGFSLLQQGKSYRLDLESWYWHPELKSVPRKMAEGQDETPRYYHIGLGECP